MRFLQVAPLQWQAAMTMQEGIGRGGYRLLALVFFGLGVLGLAMVIYAFDPSDFVEWLGVVLALASGVALLAVILLGIHPLGSDLANSRSNRAEPAQTVLNLSEATGDASDPGFDFPDDVALEPLPEPIPEPTPPPPTPLERAQARFAKEDTKGWPGRRAPSGLTRGEAKAMEAKAAKAPRATLTAKERHELRSRREPAQESELHAELLTGSPEPPLLLGKAAGPNPKLTAASTLGKCGNCGLLVLAPRTRPIRLKCPRCERVHRLD